MEWIPVSSSNVDAVGYEPPPVARLYVRFGNGREYIYENVPEHVFDGLMSASSVGNYIHQNVRKVYGFSEIR